MLRPMAKLEIPPDLRTRLEQARLDLKALFRALDRMDLSPEEIPQRLIRQLFEIDADFVEALWALDRSPGALDLQSMLRDTLAALEKMPKACAHSKNAFPNAPIPPSPSWNQPSALASPRQTPTLWFLVAIPSFVKHPSRPSTCAH